MLNKLNGERIYKINYNDMSKAKARKQLKKLLATGTGSKSKIKKLRKRINKKRRHRSWRQKLHIVPGSFEQGKRR
jgi:hypothetical protein